MKKIVLCHIGPGEDMPGGILSVIKSYMNSKYLHEYEQLHLNSVSASQKISQFLKCIHELIGVLGSNETIVHIHMSERGSCLRTIIIVNICKQFRTPVIVHSHGSEIIDWFNNTNIIIRKLFVHSMRKTDRIIVLTHGWKKFWNKIVDEKQIEVIPNFVTFQEYRDKEYLIDKKLKVLFLGQIGERKGIYDLIHAINVLKENNRNINLEVGGDGEIQKCKALVKTLNLEDNVQIMGWLSGEEKKKALYNSDCLVLPSRNESFGIVILEAMINQLPCICGDEGFTKEIVKDGVNGFVAKSGDPNSIAEHLKKLYDPELLKRFGDSAYAHVIEEYTEEKVIIKLIHVYQEIARS